MTEIDVEFVEEIDDGDRERVEEGDEGRSDIDAPEYVLYGGKGGVGKTTMAAATALVSAREGVPTLVVSTDPAHSLSDVLDHDVPAEPALVHEEYPLFGVEIDPDESDKAGGANGADGSASQGTFFGIGSPFAGLRLGPFGGGNGGFGGLGSGSDPFGAPMPGADEAAALRVLLTYLDDDRFERVVVDTAPTGHTLRLLELPDRLDATLDRVLAFRERLEGMFSAFSGATGDAESSDGSGPSGFPGFAGFPGFGGNETDRADESGEGSTADGAKRAGSEGANDGPFGGSDSAGLDDLRELRDRLALLDRAFSDPERTDFRIVLVPEKTSVVESRRLLDRLAAFDIPVGTIVVNRVMEDLGTVLGTGSGEGVGKGTRTNGDEAGGDEANGDEAAESERDHGHDRGDREGDAEGDADGDGQFVAPRPDSCPFCRGRLDSQMDALSDADDLFRGHTIKRVPLLATEVRGEKLLGVVAACLA